MPINRLLRKSFYFFYTNVRNRHTVLTGFPSPPQPRGARWPPAPRICDCYIFSGAATPMRDRQLAMTARTVSASLRRAASTAASSPLIRQAL